MSGAALKVGDLAPAFSLPTTGGGRVALADLQGQTVVLYFYPKDDTPGCTQQAISFGEKADEFAAVGAIVIGVSRDSLASHEKFVTKHGLQVTLASDVEGEACEAYGVWKEKSLYGRKFMGIERSTFVIDAQGRLAGVFRKVKAAHYVSAPLEAAQKCALQMR
jgi:peroxiredoxin Q/BCP